VNKFGSPQHTDHGYQVWASKVRLGALIAVVVAAATVAILRTPSPSHATIAMAASYRPVPRSVGLRLLDGRQTPGVPIPPRTRIDAIASLSNGRNYVVFSYLWHGWNCEVDYFGTARSVSPSSSLGGVAPSCRPPGSPRPPIDLQIAGGSGQPFFVSGTVAQNAQELAITSGTGHTHVFVLPHVALHSDPSRQVVILDLGTCHIRSVNRLTLLDDGRTVASQVQGTA